MKRVPRRDDDRARKHRRSEAKDVLTHAGFPGLMFMHEHGEVYGGIEKVGPRHFVAHIGTLDNVAFMPTMRVAHDLPRCMRARVDHEDWESLRAAQDALRAVKHKPIAPGTWQRLEPLREEE